MQVEFELKDSFLINRSKTYDNIYNYFCNKKKIFSMAELFTISAVIGFVKDNKVDFSNNRGKDIRSEYFRTNELMNIYVIMIKSRYINATIDNFVDYQFIKDSFKHIEEYAEGGMQILCKEVFAGNWDGNDLKESYDNYELDILGYIYEKRIADAF